MLTLTHNGVDAYRHTGPRPRPAHASVVPSVGPLLTTTVMLDEATGARMAVFAAPLLPAFVAIVAKPAVPWPP